MATSAKKKSTQADTAASTPADAGVKGSTLRLVHRLVELPEKTREEAERRAQELLGRLLETRAAEVLEQVPERAVEELDELLDKVGLLRVRRHEELLETAKKRARAAGRRAAKREAAKAAAKAAAKTAKSARVEREAD